MAWKYRPIRVYFKFRDGKETIASCYVHLLEVETLPLAHSYAAALADAMAGGSGAEVIGFDIQFQARYLRPPAPASTSDAFRQGILLCGTTVAEDRYLFEIASLRTDLLLTTGEYAGEKIDQTKPEIQALVNLLLTGDGTVAPTGLTGNDLDHIREAYMRRL
jgi:hypothetical protein